MHKVVKTCERQAQRPRVPGNAAADKWPTWSLGMSSFYWEVTSNIMVVVKNQVETNMENYMEAGIL